MTARTAGRSSRSRAARIPRRSRPTTPRVCRKKADFEGPLIDAKAKGATLEDLGSVDIDGAPTYAIRATLKNGDQMTYYLDPVAMLAVRVETRQLVRGAETLTDTDYGDYEKVDGVYFPFEIASGPKGATDLQRITYDTIVANIPVDPTLFAPSGRAGVDPQERGSQAMSRATTIVSLAGLLAGTMLGAAWAASGAAPVFNSAMISGLGARNIGSATMSGRIASLAARAEPDGKTLIPGRRGVGRRVEVQRRRHDLPADLRQTGRAVHRRHRARPEKP